MSLVKQINKYIFLNIELSQFFEKRKIILLQQLARFLQIKI